MREERKKKRRRRIKRVNKMCGRFDSKRRIEAFYDLLEDEKGRFIEPTAKRYKLLSYSNVWRRVVNCSIRLPLIESLHVMDNNFKLDLLHRAPAVSLQSLKAGRYLTLLYKYYIHNGILNLKSRECPVYTQKSRVRKFLRRLLHIQVLSRNSALKLC